MKAPTFFQDRQGRDVVRNVDHKGQLTQGASAPCGAECVVDHLKVLVGAENRKHFGNVTSSSCRTSPRTNPRYWYLIATASGSTDPSKQICRLPRGKILRVSHGGNGLGYRENPTPVPKKSISTSEIGYCIWLSRVSHHQPRRSILVPQASGRRSPLRRRASQANRRSNA